MRLSCRKRAGASALLVLIGSLSSGPTRGQPEPIRTTSEAVVVDFVVRDGRGKPIQDLRPDEVEVLEDGIPQDILSFGASRLAVTGSDPISPASPAATLSTRGLAGVPAADLRFPSLVAMVFDQLGISSRNLAGQACRDFVRRHAGPETLISVWVIGHRLQVIQEFTNDRELLELAVSRATSLAEVPYQDLSAQVMDRMQRYLELRRSTREGGADTLNAVAPRIDTIDMKVAELTLNITRISEAAQREQQGRATLIGLMRLFRGMGEVSGRKSVVYFSEGIEIPPGVEELFDASIHEANRHQVAVYAVDARGLQTERQLEDAARSQQMAAEMGRLQQTTFTAFFTLEDIKLVDTSREVIFKNPQGFLRALAESAGGFLVANTNNFAPALERVAEDQSFHYELAYVPKRLVYDGRFRRIEVRVRRPGVSLQARSGYFAMPPDPGFQVLPHEFPLLQALNTNSERQELALESRVLRFAAAEWEAECTLVAEMPLNGLRFEPREGRFQSRFSVLALVRDGDGQVVEKYSQHYPVSVPRENLNAVRGSFAVFLKNLRLEPGRYTLEAAAFDGKDRIGVVRRPLEIAPSRPGIRTSSIVLLREARVREDGSDDPDPLNYRNLRLLPRVGKVPFQAGSALPVYLVVYPESEVAEAPSLTLVLSKAGREFQSVAVQLPDPDRYGRVPVVLSLPLDWFPPGDYTVAAQVGQGESRFEERLDFTVE